MARRTSTRYKIRERADQIKRSITHCFENYQIMESMAEGKSTYLNETLPPMIQFLAEYEKIFDRFYEGL